MKSTLVNINASFFLAMRQIIATMSRIRANTDFRRRTTQITARRPTYSPPPPPSETANTLTQTQVTLQKDDFIEISKPAIEVSCPGDLIDM